MTFWNWEKVNSLVNTSDMHVKGHLVENSRTHKESLKGAKVSELVLLPTPDKWDACIRHKNCAKSN